MNAGEQHGDTVAAAVIKKWCAVSVKTKQQEERKGWFLGAYHSKQDDKKISLCGAKVKRG